MLPVQIISQVHSSTDNIIPAADVQSLKKQLNFELYIFLHIHAVTLSL